MQLQAHYLHIEIREGKQSILAAIETAAQYGEFSWKCLLISTLMYAPER